MSLFLDDVVFSLLDGNFVFKLLIIVEYFFIFLTQRVVSSPVWYTFLFSCLFLWGKQPHFHLGGQKRKDSANDTLEKALTHWSFLSQQNVYFVFIFFFLYSYVWPSFCSRPPMTDWSLHLCSLSMKANQFYFFFFFFDIMWVQCEVFSQCQTHWKVTPWQKEKKQPKHSLWTLSVHESSEDAAKIKPNHAECDSFFFPLCPSAALKGRQNLLRIRGVCSPSQALDDWSPFYLLLFFPSFTCSAFLCGCPHSDCHLLPLISPSFCYCTMFCPL